MNVKLKNYIIDNLCIDHGVRRKFFRFRRRYPAYSRNNKLSAISYIFRLNWAQYRNFPLQSVRLPEGAIPYYTDNDTSKTFADDIPYYHARSVERLAVEEFVGLLMPYDIISFDIFDTAVFRKVELPKDVFQIMASEIGFDNFFKVRKQAESTAREKKDRQHGTREIILSEIYEVLEDRYGIDPQWQQREAELEIELSTGNPYIRAVYDELIARKKTVIFTSDMYLPRQTIESMLEKAGYRGYHAFYLSNELGLRKGDGTLQKKLIEDLGPGSKIIHIGDNEASDYHKSVAAGIDAYHYPDQRWLTREPDMDNLAGSFYRAVINNTLGCGTWSADPHFEHGFRVGGILAAGYCQYINRLAEQKKCDKILFCSRDCFSISAIYTKFYATLPNEYIHISRYAILSITTERYLYDLISRSFLRHVRENRTSRTISDILTDAGFDFLIEYLDDDDIDPYLFPSNISEKKLEDFFFNHKDIIISHNAASRAAAVSYFSQIIGDAKSILIVDVGWSGTCISGLRYFLEHNLPDTRLTVHGALMCTSRNEALTASVSDGSINAYVCSPFSNMDLTRFMMPVRQSAKALDLLHMPLEYLFTSTEESLVHYSRDNDNNLALKRTGNRPANASEIEAMHEGMRHFVELFESYSSSFSHYFTISSYVAFNPLREVIQQPRYCYEIYKNFTYDAAPVPYARAKTLLSFGNLFDFHPTLSGSATETGRYPKEKRILFVSPEMIYTGAPRSLLRMCKVALAEGYEPIVWTAKAGPFMQEFAGINIPVTVVTEKQLRESRYQETIRTVGLAVCNTIVTDAFVRACQDVVPVVWYIREATNIPDFCRNNPTRLETLKNSPDLYCVSSYAANAITRYSQHTPKIVPNCIEDVSHLSLPYKHVSSSPVRFIQLGTIEYRKGYDVIASAYKALPERYRRQAELSFAGGFISSGTSFASRLFAEIKNDNGITYLGEIHDEKKKIEVLSQADVVVVASRDEASSLVALEGVMLSKPLIVTENVGAKYLVTAENGLVIPTGDVKALSQAMMHMIDHRESFAAMGAASREQYERLANMDVYHKNMMDLFSLAIDDHTAHKPSSTKNQTSLFNKKRLKESIYLVKSKKAVVRGQEQPRMAKDCIVSLTSFPGRIDTTHHCIESLLKQKLQPRRIMLYLSSNQFSARDKSLPDKLLSLVKDNFQIQWVDDDLAPHKKYLYSMQSNPESAVIIVDDDAVYSEDLVANLYESYHKFPHAISCMRANLMMFRQDGSFRKYDNWIYDYKMLIDKPTYQLLPVGVGGVLYPPGAIPKSGFNTDAIKACCLFCDDLWLKIFATSCNYPAVIPSKHCGFKLIPGSQENGLYKKNAIAGRNDIALREILDHYRRTIGNSDELVDKMRVEYAS